MHLDAGAVALGQFLHHDGVGTGRHEAAGEDAGGFAGADLGRKRPAGGNFADDFQAGRGGSDIAGAHRVTVHGRDIGRRLGAARFEIESENAAGGLVERHLFGRQGRCVRQYVIERLGNGNQCHVLLPRAKMAAAAAAFFHEPDALDAHAAVDRFHHVIDGEAGDRNGGERFHLDAGLAGHFYARGDADAGQLGIGRDVDSTCDNSRGWHSGINSWVRLAAMMPAMRAVPSTSPFLASPLRTMSSVFAVHQHAAFGHRHARGGGLGRDVDHVGFAARAEMGEFFRAARHGFTGPRRARACERAARASPP